ncbi:unnamed protein product, partial [Polarella glacialis]
RKRPEMECEPLHPQSSGSKSVFSVFKQKATAAVTVAKATAKAAASAAAKKLDQLQAPSGSSSPHQRFVPPARIDGRCKTPEFVAGVQKLKAMGFQEDLAELALTRTQGDVAAASEVLLGDDPPTSSPETRPPTSSHETRPPQRKMATPAQLAPFVHGMWVEMHGLTDMKELNGRVGRVVENEAAYSKGRILVEIDFKPKLLKPWNLVEAEPESIKSRAKATALDAKRRAENFVGGYMGSSVPYSAGGSSSSCSPSHVAETNYWPQNTPSSSSSGPSPISSSGSPPGQGKHRQELQRRVAQEAAERQERAKRAAYPGNGNQTASYTSNSLFQQAASGSNGSSKEQRHRQELQRGVALEAAERRLADARVRNAGTMEDWRRWRQEQNLTEAKRTPSTSAPAPRAAFSSAPPRNLPSVADSPQPDVQRELSTDDDEAEDLQRALAASMGPVSYAPSSPSQAAASLRPPFAAAANVRPPFASAA